MSLLWKDKTKKNLLINFRRPSPKHNKYIPCFAQSKFPYLNNKFPVCFKEKYLKNYHSIKGISLFTSRRGSVEGSMTVEASIVLPLFMFFFLNLNCAIEMIRLHGNLELALWDVGNRLSVYGHILSEESKMLRKNEKETQANWENNKIKEVDSENFEMSQTEQEDGWWVELAGIALSSTYVKGRIVDYLGEEYLESSPLKEGIESLLFVESDISESEDTFEIAITYSVSPLNAISGFKSFRMANKYYGHFWNGYELSMNTAAEAQYVYVTENGTVYHMDEDCTHLKLSIQQVNFSEVLLYQNENGERYGACQKCCEGIPAESVYITSEGARYHFERYCPGLKRTIYCVAISQMSDLKGCSRCVGK